MSFKTAMVAAMLLALGGAGPSLAQGAAVAEKPMTYGDASYCYAIYATILTVEENLHQRSASYPQMANYATRVRADAIALGARAGMSRAQVDKDMAATAEGTMDRFVDGGFTKPGQTPLSEYVRICGVLIDRYAKEHR